MISKVIYLPVDKYGGVFTFFLSIINTLNLTSSDLIIVQSTISSELIKIINEKTNAEIKVANKKFENVILNRLYTSIFLLGKYRRNSKIIFVDFNPLLDFGAFFYNDVICFTHAIPMRKLPYIFRYVLTKLVNRKNFKLIAVSDYQKNKLKNTYYTIKSEIGVLKNHSSLKPIVKRRVLKKPTIVASIGHCVSYKGVSEWIKIAQALESPDLVFRWYGDGPELEKSRQITKENKYIEFLGYEKNINKIINQIDIYTQLSKRENLSISVLDSMSQGIPVIGTKVGAMDELIEHGYNGYIVETIEESIYYINRLATAPRIYENMSKNALKKYNSEFAYEHWKKTLKKYL